MAEIDAILDIYNNSENKVEARVNIAGNVDSVPRTSHSMSKIIDKLAASPIVPKRHLSQKAVRKILFDDNDDNYIVYHASDLDQESEVDNDDSFSISSSQGEDALKEKEYLNAPSDHSLTRVIASHIYDDQDRFQQVEEEIMKHEYETHSSSSYNFGSLHPFETRPLLQAISNIYSLDIHFYKSGSSSKVREIISPIDSWSLKEKNRPLNIIQLQRNKFALKAKAKKRIGFKNLDGREHERAKIEDTMRQAIVDGFNIGQNWTEKDEKLRSLIIQGPSSIEDLNVAFNEDGGGTDHSEDDKEKVQDESSSASEDEGGSNLSSKISRQKFSPSLSRSNWEKQSNLRKNDSFDFHLGRAITEAVL